MDEAFVLIKKYLEMRYFYMLINCIVSRDKKIPTCGTVQGEQPLLTDS